MPVQASGVELFLGLWGLASVAVAASFSLLLRGTDRRVPVPGPSDDAEPCDCLGCRRVGRPA